MRLRDLWAWWTRPQFVQTKAEAFRVLFQKDEMPNARPRRLVRLQAVRYRENRNKPVSRTVRARF